MISVGMSDARCVVNRGGEPLVIKTGRHAIISAIKQARFVLLVLCCS